MSILKYNVVPKSNGGFTTRVLLADEFEDSEVDNIVATTTGLTVAQCVAVLTAYHQTFGVCASGCGWTHDFHGLFSMRPTSGGSATTPDGFHNAQDINANVSYSILPVVRDAWQSTLTIESQGQIGLLVPNIDSIIDLSDGAQDSYTPAEIMQLSGENLGFDKTALDEGVFYETAAAPGTKVRINSYGTISPTEINAIMPAGVTGVLTISVAIRISGSLRTATYVHTLS